MLYGCETWSLTLSSPFICLNFVILPGVKIQTGLTRLFKFYWVKETNLGLNMNDAIQVLAYADDINLIGDDIRKKVRCVIKCL